MSAGDLPALVARASRASVPERALRRDLAGVELDWKAAEQEVARAIDARPRRAAALLRGLDRIARIDGTAEALGRAARARGSWLASQGRFAASLAPYQEAAARLRGAARDGAVLGIAAALLRLGRFDDARAACRRVRAAARRRGDALLAAGADFNEAVALHESGRPERALELYDRAARGFGAAGHGTMAASAANNRANALVLLDRHAEAALLFEAAARGYESAGLPHLAARTRINQGALLVATDRLGDAEEVLRSAETALARAGDAAQAGLSRLDRGEALLRAGLLPEARHALSSARRSMGRRVPPVERRRAALLLAETELAAGRPAEAARALPRDVPASDSLARGRMLEIRGRCHAAVGRLGAAIRTLGQAARTYGRLRPVPRARARAAGAWCCAEAGDLAAARRQAKDAQRAARDHPVPSLRFLAHAVRFVVEDRAGRRPAAQEALDCALDALDRLRDGLGPDTMRAALLRGREEWFAHAVRHTLDGPEGPTRALALVERWRARALRDLMVSAGGRRDPDPAVEALRSEVAALERRVEGTLPAGFVRLAPGGGRVVGRLAKAEAELARALQRRGGPAGASEPFDVARFRSSLPAGVAVLCLFADEEGTCIFVLTRDGMDVALTPMPRSQVQERVRELHHHLGHFTLGAQFASRHAARLARATDRHLEELAAATLDPVRDRLRDARKLVVVPHGPWHHVPWAALPMDGAPLAATREVVLCPALSSLTWGGRRARGRPVVVAFADDAAPAVAEEAERVTATLPGGRLLRQEQATLHAIAARPRPSCLHVASHGRFRADAPAMSAVRLSDGWLRAVDLSTLDLRGSMVVLSGCETGVSAVDAGDEAQGLVRGAFAAGARELVASLWRVDDPATARLMARMHSLRAEGLSTPAALGRSQFELAREGLHPWYWAGFVAWARALPA